MTPEQWAAANGIIDRYWYPREDAYAFLLNTGQHIKVRGDEFQSACGSRISGNRLAMLVRERWLDLQYQHFVDAHARGGYC